MQIVFIKSSTGHDKKNIEIHSKLFFDLLQILTINTVKRAN